MLCFAMALKSARVSKDWDMVCQLVDATLWSAYNQTDPDFRIIVVGHEPPKLARDYDERYQFYGVDFDPPAEITTPLCMQDKWTKMLIALYHAGKLEPDHLMLMDADDLVSRRIVEFVHKENHPNGWIITTSYDWPAGSKWMRKNPEFNCGTNAVLNANQVDFPQSTDPEERNRCIALRAGHGTIAQVMQERNTPLGVMPFCGAMYISDHGDNDSHFGGKKAIPRWYLSKTQWRRRIYRWSQQRPMTNAIRRDFSMMD